MMTMTIRMWVREQMIASNYYENFLDKQEYNSFDFSNRG